MKISTDYFPNSNYSQKIITPEKWYYVFETIGVNADGVPINGTIKTDQGHNMRVVLDGPCPQLNGGYWEVDWYN